MSPANTSAAAWRGAFEAADRLARSRALQVGVAIGVGLVARRVASQVNRVADRGLVDWHRAESIAVSRLRRAPGSLSRAELERSAPAYEAAMSRIVPILEHDGVTAGCPLASRVPYEVLIAPSRGEPEGLRSDLLAPALRLLAELVRRLQRIERAPLVPLNAWLHEGPNWHLELVPRTTRLAGLELGAGVYLNPVSPEEAAASLRTA